MLRRRAPLGVLLVLVGLLGYAAAGHSSASGSPSSARAALSDVRQALDQERQALDQFGKDETAARQALNAAGGYLVQAMAYISNDIDPDLTHARKDLYSAAHDDFKAGQTSAKKSQTSFVENAIKLKLLAITYLNDYIAAPHHSTTTAPTTTAATKPSTFNVSAPIAASATNFCILITTSPAQHVTATATLTSPENKSVTKSHALDAKGQWLFVLPYSGGGSYQYKVTVPGEQYPSQGNPMLDKPFSTPGVTCP